MVVLARLARVFTLLREHRETPELLDSGPPAAASYPIHLLFLSAFLERIIFAGPWDMDPGNVDWGLGIYVTS